MMTSRDRQSSKKLTSRTTANVFIVLLILPSLLPAVCQAHCRHWKIPTRGHGKRYDQRHSTSHSRKDGENMGYSKVYSNVARTAYKIPTGGTTTALQPISSKHGRPSPPPPWQGSVVLTQMSPHKPVAWRTQLSRPPPRLPLNSFHGGMSVPSKRNTMKPPALPPRAVTRESQKCPGRKNLLDDIGVFSLLLATVSSTFGLYTILVNSMTSNSIGIVSGFLSLVLWLPSTLIALSNLSGHHIEVLSHLLNSMSFVNSMYGFMGVIFGTADVLASAAGESVGIMSLFLSIVATFPEFLDGIISYLSRNTGPENRRTLEYYVDNYGCSVPSIFRLIGKPIYNKINDYLVQAVAVTQPGRGM